MPRVDDVQPTAHDAGRTAAGVLGATEALREGLIWITEQQCVGEAVGGEKPVEDELFHRSAEHQEVAGVTAWAADVDTTPNYGNKHIKRRKI